MASKLTPLQKAYNKEVQRIERSLKAAEKRGYIIPKSLWPEKLTNPKLKSLENIKNVRIQDIYNKRNVKYVDPFSGELMSGKAGRKLEQSRAAKKAAETRAKNKDEGGTTKDYPEEGYEVLRRVMYMITSFVPYGTPMQKERRQRQKETMSFWIREKTRSEEDTLAMARAFQGRAQEAVQLTDKALTGYYEDLVYCITMFAQWVKGSALTVEESKDLEADVSEYYYEQ